MLKRVRELESRVEELESGPKKPSVARRVGGAVFGHVTTTADILRGVRPLPGVKAATLRATLRLARENATADAMVGSASGSAELARKKPAGWAWAAPLRWEMPESWPESWEIPEIPDLTAGLTDKVAEHPLVRNASDFASEVASEAERYTTLATRGLPTLVEDVTKTTTELLQSQLAPNDNDGGISGFGGFGAAASPKTASQRRAAARSRRRAMYLPPTQAEPLRAGAPGTVTLRRPAGSGTVTIRRSPWADNSRRLLLACSSVGGAAGFLVSLLRLTSTPRLVSAALCALVAAYVSTWRNNMGGSVRFLGVVLLSLVQKCVDLYQEQRRQASFVYKTGLWFEQMDAQLHKLDRKLGSPSKNLNDAVGMLGSEISSRSREIGSEIASWSSSVTNQALEPIGSTLTNTTASATAAAADAAAKAADAAAASAAKAAETAAAVANWSASATTAVDSTLKISSAISSVGRVVNELQAGVQEKLSRSRENTRGKGGARGGAEGGAARDGAEPPMPGRKLTIDMHDGWELMGE